MRRVIPISPGEMLDEEFLKPLGLSKYRLAKEIGVPAGRISEIVAGCRAMQVLWPQRGMVAARAGSF